MKTVSQLDSGNKPVGTTAYMARVEQLMQYHSDVKKGIVKLEIMATLITLVSRYPNQIWFQLILLILTMPVSFMSCNTILVFIPCS